MFLRTFKVLPPHFLSLLHLATKYFNPDISKEYSTLAKLFVYIFITNQAFDDPSFILSVS